MFHCHHFTNFEVIFAIVDDTHTHTHISREKSYTHRAAAQNIPFRPYENVWQHLKWSVSLSLCRRFWIWSVIWTEIKQKQNSEHRELFDCGCWLLGWINVWRLIVGRSFLRFFPIWPCVWNTLRWLRFTRIEIWNCCVCRCYYVRRC